MTAQYSEKRVSDGTRNVKQLLDRRLGKTKGSTLKAQWRSDGYEGSGQEKAQREVHLRKLLDLKWETLELPLAIRRVQ